MLTGTLGNLTDGFVTSGGTLYHDFTASLNVTEAPNTTPSFTIGGGPTQSNAMNFQMWVDWNNNGVFETSERVGGGTILANTPRISNLTIGNVSPGVYRYRVVVCYATGNPADPSIPPCPTTAISYADTRDYTMIIGPPPCSGTPNPGIVAATALSACNPPVSNFTPTLMNVGSPVGAGISYNWQSSSTGLAGSWINVSGATNAIYTPTISAVGVTYFRNSVSCSFGSTAFSSVLAVSLNPAPTPITGNLNMCIGVPSTLISLPTGGTWSTSNTATATAGSLSGAITGSSVGQAIITYTLPTGCIATATATVNTQPAAIVGTNAICIGQTINYSDATPGGTWSASPTTVGTIGTGSGSYSGLGAGTGLVVYTSSAGCQALLPVTVNALPGLFILSGGGNYCVGSASTLSITLSGSQSGFTYQLYLNGSPTGLPALAGTGGALNFGVQSSAGTYTCIATNNTTGCSRQMVGSPNIVINTIPLQCNVSGGGSYCFGVFTSAPHIYLGCSQVGVNYKLMLGASVYVTIGGTGGALDFGPCTIAGCYTVVAQNGTTGCTANMLGSACVTINTAPTGFNVLPTGGGSYCIGGPGIDVQLDYSNTGVSYSLYNSGTFVSTRTGTGALIDFGMQSAAGTYTVVGTNVTTGCSGPMLGATTITINDLPSQHNVSTATGGTSGSYCAGGAGIEIVLDASDGGVNYQLYNGVIPVGVAVGGTGLPINFGFQTAAGNYTVVATDATTLCSNNMVGSASIIINPLPPVGTVTGGGNFCVGGAGRHIGINPTTVGVSYQLIFGGSPLGSPVAGTGGAIDFGIFSTVGIYTVVATNTTTGCTRPMGGVATISTNPLPYAFNVTGSGSFCSGTSGMPIGLDFSATGVTYQLYRNGVVLGTPVSGTGAPISFGYFTNPGTYTVVGTNVSTSCTANMSGSAVISVSALPSSHLVTGGGNFCAGDAGRHVGVNGSETGISYQLFLGTSALGAPVDGTGSLLDFGLETLGGTYTVIATNTTTGCTRNMVGSAAINVYALPTQYTVSGGGLYCAGTAGVHIGLSGSGTGIKYQLYNGGIAVGVPLAGTGAAIDFGLYLASGTYSVKATNIVTGCGNDMLGSVTVATSPLPTQYTVTGGGNYCVGGNGVSVGLSGSEPSVNYQLYRGAVMVGSALPGTGADLDFGLMTATGTYTIVATNSVTTCTKVMAGNAVIGLNPLPAAYAVSGGGNYCAGGAGYHVYLGGSAIGIDYVLYKDAVATSVTRSGTGSGLDFGAITDAGSYTVVATNTATTCIKTMSGSATIGVYPLPATHNVTGGGSYCSGGTGVNIGLDGSNFGILYQLYQGSTPVGVPVSGTGSNINFGLHTAAATYSIAAVNNATSCTSNMVGNAVVAIKALPQTYAVTGGGTYCETGLGVHVNLSGSEAGVKYQLWNGATVVGVPVTGTGGALDFGLETIVGSYTATATNPTTTCSNNMTGSAAVNTLPVLLPHVDIVASIPGLVCAGQLVNFTANPVNGGTSPSYQWFINNVGVAVGSTYSYIPVDGDVVVAKIRSNYQCAIPDTGNGTRIMNVSAPQMPSATVDVNPGTQICSGGTATFTATTAYGGSAPTQRWIKNGNFVASGASYSYVPANGDIISFMLGSNFACRLADTVFGNNTTLTVEPAVLPVVNISTNPGSNVTIGQSVTFTAIVTHGSTHPKYQWVVNSTSVAGATNSSYTTSNINDRDSVSVMVEGSCGLVGFNSVGMRVHAAGVGVNAINSNNDVVLMPNPNKGDFTVKGTLSSNVDQEVILEVTNMLGQVVYTNKVVTHGGNINEHIQLNNLANGMYLMNLRSGAENSVFHFVIEQ